MNRAILLDMDGTLLRLEVDIEAVRAELVTMFAGLGFDASFAPILATIDSAAQAVAASAGEAAALVRRGRDLIDAGECAAAARARPRRGAAALLAEIERRQWPVGLVTDNGRACVAPAISGAGLDSPLWRRAKIVTRDDVDQPKPAPDGVVAAATPMLDDGGTLWYVGDSPRDISAGHAARDELAGIEVITVALEGGRGSSAALRAAGPDVVIDALDQLWSHIT